MLQSCSLPYDDSHIITAVWSDYIWSSCSPFWLKYSIKSFYVQLSQNYACLLI